jgi:hypothetical protein
MSRDKYSSVIRTDEYIDQYVIVEIYYLDDVNRFSSSNSEIKILRT